MLKQDLTLHTYWSKFSRDNASSYHPFSDLAGSTLLSFRWHYRLFIKEQNTCRDRYGDVGPVVAWPWIVFGARMSLSIRPSNDITLPTSLFPVHLYLFTFFFLQICHLEKVLQWLKIDFRFLLINLFRDYKNNIIIIIKYAKYSTKLLTHPFTIAYRQELNT